MQKMIKGLAKINFMACESHALKHRDDFRCATCGILGYALKGLPNLIIGHTKTTRKGRPKNMAADIKINIFL
ncbi:MAG: hypothetical protein LBT59_25850 [Clostridiales bacterium]|jgi:hypothetical protein|nr:hypothetical protein [Clostridiales bacterium]